jgi:hypothetical protein
MRSCTRVQAVVLIVLTIACAACGGGAPRSQNADMLASNQPTPDPTLDAVVRALPKELAGTAATPTPSPVAVLPKPVVKQAAPTATAPKTTAPKPTATVAKTVATQAKPAAPTPKPAATPSRPAAPVASPTRH